MKPVNIAEIIIALLIIGVIILILLLGCTIKVEPIKKPQPVVIYKTPHHKKHHHKTKPAATPASESLQSKRFPVPDYPQDKLIGQPEPQSTP